jgi:hypothetical protein
VVGNLKSTNVHLLKADMTVFITILFGKIIDL